MQVFQYNHQLRGGIISIPVEQSAGVWGNQVSPCPRPPEGRGGRSPPAGGWGNRVAPSPHPVGGSGRAQPSQEQPVFIPSARGGAAWTAAVTIGYESLSLPPQRRRRPSPPPNLPPLGGGAGLPPQRGEGWGGGHHLRCNGLPLKQGDGATGCPIPPPGGRVWEGVALPGTTGIHPVGARRSRMDG